jgi:uncharacterized protein YcfL
MLLFRILLVITAFVALSSLAGCKAAQPLPDEPVRELSLEEFFAPPADKLLSTADSMVLKAVRTRFEKGALKRVDFKLLNNRGRRNVVTYRVQWLDKDGMLAAPYTDWKPLALEGHQETVVTEKAPLNSTDYRLEIQTN